MTTRQTILVGLLCAACNAVPNPSADGSAHLRSAQGAAACGGATVRGANVLVITDDSSIADPNQPATTIEQLLVAAGNTVTVTKPTTGAAAFYEYNWDPTVAYPLDTYDVVVHLDGTQYVDSLQVSPQQALVNFVKAGHGFVSFQFDGYEKAAKAPPQVDMAELVPMGSDMNNYFCMACDVDAAQEPSQASHPILAGVDASFRFHADAWTSEPYVDDAIPGSTPATILLSGNQFGAINPAVPVAFARNVGTGRVFNFTGAAGYGPANGTLQNVNVQKMLVNAVKWAANLPATPGGTAPIATISDPQPPPPYACVLPKDTIHLQLDGSGSTGSGTLSYAWTDSRGTVIAAVAKPDVMFDVGRHQVSLVVSTGPGCDSVAAVSTIDVVGDTTPPTIAVDPPTIMVECNSSKPPFSDLGATASDTCMPAAGSWPVGGSGAVDTSKVGTYPVTYTTTDKAGNVGTATRSVIVQDTVAPVVDHTAPMTVECGDSFTPPTTSAKDACVGPLSASVTANTVNTAKTGDYAVTYTAKDPSSNSGTDTLAVRVADTLPPTVALNGSASVTLECNVDTYVEAGATASDKCSGNLTSSIATSGTVDRSKKGPSAVTYSVVDGAGLKGSATRTVTVVDRIAPQLSIKPMQQFWSPSHELRTLHLSDCASVVPDACDGALDIDKVGSIVSISSDEFGEDDDIALIGPSTFQIRLERNGGGNGRVYTVAFRVKDSSGNARDGVCQFGVPPNQSGSPAAVDDGRSRGYTVTPASYHARDRHNNHRDNGGDDRWRGRKWHRNGDDD
jgi:hypothetical protein